MRIGKTCLLSLPALLLWVEAKGNPRHFSCHRQSACDCVRLMLWRAIVGCSNLLQHQCCSTSAGTLPRAHLPLTIFQLQISLKTVLLALLSERMYIFNTLANLFPIVGIVCWANACVLVLAAFARLHPSSIHVSSSSIIVLLLLLFFYAGDSSFSWQPIVVALYIPHVETSFLLLWLLLISVPLPNTYFCSIHPLLTPNPPSPFFITSISRTGRGCRRSCRESWWAVRASAGRIGRSTTVC